MQRAAPRCQLLAGMQPHLTAVCRHRPWDLVLRARLLEKGLAACPDTGPERGTVLLSTVEGAGSLGPAQSKL